jgi:hypothetical protein
VVIDAPLAVGISVGPSQITFTEVKQFRTRRRKD